MKSQLANLRSLQLPFDAGPTDPRIVIDGENGTITGYSSGGDVLWLLDIRGGLNPTRGIWSADFAASTALADLEAVEHVHIEGDTITISEGGADSAAEIRASAGSGLVLKGYVDDPGDPSRVTLSCTELAITDTGSGSSTGDPIITITGTTGGFGDLTFSHGMSQTPRLILPIMESPVGERVNAIDNYTSTQATAWCSAGSTSVTFRALVIL